MKKFHRSWAQHFKQLAQRLIPSYQGAGRLRIGADKRDYGKTNWATKLIVSLSLLSLAAVLPVWWINSAADTQKYQERLQVALANKDYADAKSSMVALLKQSPDNLDYRWCQASIEEQLGEREAAEAMRVELAQRGYGPAIVWLADHLYRLEDFDKWSDEQHRDFVSLLENVSHCSVESRIELHKRLAAYRTRQGDLPSAIQALGQIATWYPVAHVNMAALHLQSGDAVQAQACAVQAREALKSRIKQVPGDVNNRLELVRALMMLDCESDALKILADGLDITGQPVMRQAAGEVLVHWARRLEKTEGREPTFWPRLQLIHRSSQCAPQDSVVLDAILDLIDECRESHERRVPELREATVQGIERVAAHTMLGYLHCVALRPENSQQHARLATMDSPEVPTLLNNLAIAMLNRPDYSVEQAAAMINLALELLPDQPHFLETRAKIIEQQSLASAIP